MTEAPKRHPAIENVYKVVQAVDPEATQALTEVEAFFRTLAKDSELPRDERPQRDEPDVLDTPIFLRPLRELDGKNPLMRLRAAIEEAREDESRKAELLREAEEKQRGKKKTPAVIFVAIHHPAPPPREKIKEPKKLVDLFVEEKVPSSPPNTYIRTASLTERFPDLSKSELNQIKRNARSSRGGKGNSRYYLLSEMEERVDTLRQERERKKQKAATKRARPERKPKVSISTEGYMRSNILSERFPDLSTTELFILKKRSSMLRKGRSGVYYLESEVLQQVDTLRQERERKKQEAEAARAERKPKAFTRPEGYISTAEALAKYPDIPIKQLRGLLVTTQDILHGGGFGKFYQEGQLDARISAYREEQQRFAEQKALEKSLPFVPPVNHLSRNAIKAEFPDISRRRAAELLSTIENVALIPGQSTYYPESEVRALFTAERKRITAKKLEKQKARDTKEDRKFERPEGHLMTNEVRAEFPDVSLSKTRTLLHRIPNVISAGNRGVYYPADVVRQAFQAQREEVTRIAEENSQRQLRAKRKQELMRVLKEEQLREKSWQTAKAKYDRENTIAKNKKSVRNENGQIQQLK